MWHRQIGKQKTMYHPGTLLYKIANLAYKTRGFILNIIILHTY